MGKHRALLCLGVGLAATVPSVARDRAGPERWITGWASAQQTPDARNALPSAASTVTLRQVVRVTAAGRTVRLRLSNAFGSAPLNIDGVHVAWSAGPGSAAIQSGSDRQVLFAGAPTVTVPPGADWWSDPVELTVAARQSLAVTMKLTVPADRQTIHTASHATSFIVPGDRLTAIDLPGAARIEHWAFLSGIDVSAAQRGNVIVALGDSITDGSWSTIDANNRWPDILANRLQANAPTRGVAVLNLGMGGNRLLLDGNGPNALARFDRDVLAQSGTRFLILLEGINDLGTLTKDGPASVDQHKLLVSRMIAGYQQIIVRAHRRGIKVIGGTLLPFAGATSYHPDVANEADRSAVNGWIRASRAFDAVVDFDRMVRDPTRPDRLLPVYDSGDHLHPSPAGYKRMGEGVPLALFRQPAG